MNSKLAALLEELEDRRTSDHKRFVTLTVAEYDLLREALREREGMVLVPREPTKAMLVAAFNEREQLMFARADYSMADQFTAVYRAMLAAAEGK